jgi:hypothetical protein
MVEAEAAGGTGWTMIAGCATQYFAQRWMRHKTQTVNSSSAETAPAAAILSGAITSAKFSNAPSYWWLVLSQGQSTDLMSSRRSPRHIFYRRRHTSATAREPSGSLRPRGGRTHLESPPTTGGEKVFGRVTLWLLVKGTNTSGPENAVRFQEPCWPMNAPLSLLVGKAVLS